jgi:hypothetical protein
MTLGVKLRRIRTIMLTLYMGWAHIRFLTEIKVSPATSIELSTSSREAVVSNPYKAVCLNLLQVSFLLAIPS